MSGTEELVEAFIACTLPKARCTHHAHLRVGLWHLWRHPTAEALALLRERIQKYNVSCGGMNSDRSGSSRPGRIAVGGERSYDERLGRAQPDFQHKEAFGGVDS